MKTRLGIFMLALLALPLAGIFFSGTSWHDLAANSPPENGSIPATLRTSIMLLVYVLLASHIIGRLSGKVDIKRFVQLGITSALTCWLLSYLNLFVASWTVPQNHTLILQLLLYTPLFALLAPAVLLTRDLFACFPGITNSLTFNFKFPSLRRETLLRILIIVTIFGLAGGAAWPSQLFWLFWIAPVTLLIALQCHSSGLQSGSLGAALSGILIGNIAVISYQSNAYLQINLPNMMAAQAGLALFGLLCLQLGKLVDSSESNQTSLIVNKS